MVRRFALAVGLLSALAAAAAAQPVWREAAGAVAPEALTAQVLEANGFWLNPPVKSLTYRFRMEHPDKADPWEAQVTFTAPDVLAVAATKRDPFQGKVDDRYDPGNSAYPPRRVTILQGVTLFGPLHEFVRAPEEHALRLIAEEKLNGKDAYVLHLAPTGEPSAEALARWDERLRKRATRPKHLYEFLPVAQDAEGGQKAVIELKCLGEEGPGWAAIQAAHQADSVQVKWGGSIITAAIREYRGETRPVIVLTRDPEFEGASPVKLTQFAGGIGNMTPKLTLGEGETAFDEAYYNQLKAEEAKPQRYLAMRVGCGIWGSWYGYSGGGAEADQLWVDKATGMVLREEGFAKGKCRFTVEYGDFQPVPAGGSAPGRVLVTLLGSGEPWIFDMRFAVVNNAAWLLSSLTESSGGRERVVVAETSDAIAERAD